MKAALTIAGLDPSGGAGIAMDLAAFRALGLHGLPVATTVTYQDTSAFEGALVLSPESVQRQLRHALATMDVAAAKTGMLADASLAVAIGRSLANTEFPLVVDPVLRATLEADDGRDAAASRRELADAIRDELLPRATLVTPNADEATLLASVEVTDEPSAKEACRRLVATGAKAVLLKGGHLPAVRGQSVDWLFADDEFHRLEAPHTKGAKVHGSGCAYSALIAGHLARGESLLDAVTRSHELVAEARSRAIQTKGHLRLFPAFHGQTHRATTPETRRLEETVQKLVRLLPAALAPEVGMNVALLVHSGDATSDVVSLDGRIHRVAGRLEVTGAPAHNSRGHVARVLLAANRAFPETRVAMNVRYHPAIVEAGKAAGLRVAAFDRAKQPSASPSSLDWGVTEALKGLKAPADLVFDTGGVGKEAMVRILARDERDLLAKVQRLLGRLDVRHVTTD